jgi:ornithine cyclodeaminase/alanine dehydrogenase-like protein (mu-crystallin family)
VTLLLTRSEVERLLDPLTCIEAVEGAFRLRGTGGRIESAVLGLHGEGGGLHVKAASLLGERSYFAAKLNANFPGNPSKHGLPTIQGALVLFDATNGIPLLVMDSIAITLLRTAAATGVAAKYLSREDATTATIVGCGAQAPHQIAALTAIRPIKRLYAIDRDRAAAERFAIRMTQLFGVEASSTDDLTTATRSSDIVITCTSSRTPFLDVRHVSPGTFIAAVGTDNEDKSEISPTLMAAADVICDDVGQCKNIGDLHHAIVAGSMKVEDVFAELHEIVADPSRAPSAQDRIVLFDSTGVAIQDVASAVVVYTRALASGAGQEIDFGA